MDKVSVEEFEPLSPEEVDERAKGDWEQMWAEVDSYHDSDPDWEKNDLIWEELPDRQSWHDSL